MYSILLDLYVPTSDSRNPRLPPELANKYTSQSSSFYTPRITTINAESIIWGNLPKSRPVEEKQSKSPKPATSLRLQTRIWSESKSPVSASIPTAQLYTPSQPWPLTQRPEKKQEIDFRFGQISVDWFDKPVLNLPRPTTDNRVWNLQERSGAAELCWGRIRLFKMTSESVSSTDVGMISVPGNLDAAALLSFLSPALDKVGQVRILKDATPNRSMVLLRFKSATDAAQFIVIYNGKPYYESKDSEICHALPLAKVKLRISDIPPFVIPSEFSASDHFGLDGQPAPGFEKAVELPTCPVCLERMDSNTTGLITIMCQHTYHCECLLRWGDSRCPVCRSTNYRNKMISTLDAATEERCTTCKRDANLWTCLVCGNIGCGRYQGAHAHSHFVQTGHAYSMELETQRVWDYIEDAYIHRLIRDRADGKLVELPSLQAALYGEDGEKEKDAYGPGRNTEENQAKLEAMGIEYSHLMTSQLTSQREYYECEMGRLNEELSGTRKKWQESELSINKLQEETAMLIKDLKIFKFEAAEREKNFETQLKLLKKENGDTNALHKKEKATWMNTQKELVRQLEGEKAVSSSLSNNLSSLREEVSEYHTSKTQLEAEVEDLRDQMKDVMFALEMRDRITNDTEGLAEAQGGDIVLGRQTTANPSAGNGAKSKKKKNRK